MKINRIFVASSLVLSALAPLASGQSFQYLDPVAAKYDLFIFEGASSGDTQMQFKEGNFEGLFGNGRNAESEIQDDVVFDGFGRIHSQSDLDFDPDGSSTGSVSTGFNSDLNAANTALVSYIGYLSGLTATQSFGNRSSAFSYTSTSDLTVLDFSSFDMNGSGDSITLNGRAGGNDVFVIRVAGDALWDDGAPVTLNNLNRRNVIWLSQNDSNFDLHKNDGANFEGVIINPSEGDGGKKSKHTTIIGDVDFKGQVYAANIKLGTDVYFKGSSTFGPPIPEPSTTLLLLSACSSLLLVRRRR